MRGRLSSAAEALEATLEAVRAVEPEALVAAVQPVHRALVAALAAHPEESLLRRSVDPLLARADPLALLGTTVDNHARYVAALEDGLAVVRRLETSHRSELTAVVGGLREALRPLTAIPDRVTAVFARFGVEVEGRSLGAIVAETLDTLTPARALAPLEPAVAALKAKVAALVDEGLVAPAQTAVADLQRVLDVLDIGFLRTELEALQREVGQEVEALRPSALLGELVTSAEQTLEAVADFDPLGAVRQVVDDMKEAIDTVVNDFRPTLLFAPILASYDDILAAAGGLDVRNLLEPILTALTEIELQLEQGLDDAATALERLQEALP